MATESNMGNIIFWAVLPTQVPTAGIVKWKPQGPDLCLLLKSSLHLPYLEMRPNFRPTAFGRLVTSGGILKLGMIKETSFFFLLLD